MNRIVLLGRLTREPEVRTTPTGKTVVVFSLAVDRPYKGRDGKAETDFINIVTWNKTAELVGTYVHKGERLLVEGRLQIRSYDGKDGQKHYVTEVIADRVEFIEKRNSSGTQAAASKTDAGPMGSFGSEVTFNEEVTF
ncbi:single-stranded DNA-binding protein [Acidaminococcus timonensis]|uniref:single-stranded DNA-binding protein n=1 Tax=Acidaminococcus timonensis TaxID=1871002 RepID=UPI002941F876|nr:single-stranded DNA-binding protein [Acidaminococcus timonensis]